MSRAHALSTEVSGADPFPSSQVALSVRATVLPLSGSGRSCDGLFGRPVPLHILRGFPARFPFSEQFCFVVSILPLPPRLLQSCALRS